MHKKKNIKNLALCSVLSALGAVILLIGSLIGVLDMSAAMIASVLLVITVVEAKGFWPWMTYAVTAIIGLLLPSKTAAIMYLLAGYYPIIKAKLEKMPKVISWIVKIVGFNISLAAALLAFAFLFTKVSLELIPGIGKILTYVLYFVLGNIIFVLYDVLLTRVISLYVFKLRDRFKFGIK